MPQGPGLAPADTRPVTRREGEIRRFVRARYSVLGTLRLHRAALGLDLLRAPLNVMLSPVFLLARLIAAALGAMGAKRAAGWLGRQQIFLTSDMGRQLSVDLIALFDRLRAAGVAPDAPEPLVRQAIAAHVETRNAVSEITTSAIVLGSGFALFHSATPGIISLAGPVAQMRAHAQAVDDFFLGNWAGRAWYGVFPNHLSVFEVVATGVVLTIFASLVTTFAGVIADPFQRWTGVHRRRLMRMMARLDRQHRAGGLEREHVLARLGDLGDVVASIWRALR